MDLRLNTIASLCRAYLTDWQRMDAEHIIKELHEATKPKEPPALGISVSESVGAKATVR